MAAFNSFLYHFLTLIFISLPTLEALGPDTSTTVYDVVSTDFGIDYSPSVVNCEADCLKYLKSGLPENSVGGVELPCANYTDLISEYVLCTTACGYPRVRNEGQCNEVRPYISRFLELKEPHVSNCTSCENISTFPKLSFDLSVRSRCIASCASFVEIESNGQVIKDKSVCDGFISQIRSTRTCYKNCRVPFLRNVSECEKYFEFDTTCNVCSDIFPDAGQGILIFSGAVVALLLGLCFLNDIVASVTKANKKNRRHSHAMTDFHYAL
mmetsp:Transcript_10677/g.13367  ORF Transcript_10677/g.13367 Transcript_10677/m.13367 type:complete len:268 (-) Transcript_10677:715-1518(-)